MEPNCERHPAHKGMYIVYDAGGFAFRASKRSGFAAGQWYARPSHLSAAGDLRNFYADSLSALCRKVGASRKAGA